MGSIPWVDWSSGGSHPARFVRKDVSEAFLIQIRNGFNCTYNGASPQFFLFARKFLQDRLVFTLRTSWRLVILRVQQSDEAANK
jgi:hypothetical protein